MRAMKDMAELMTGLDLGEDDDIRSREDLFERVRQLQNAPFVAMSPDNLDPDRQACGRKPGGHRDRRIRHERDVPAGPHPIDIRRHWFPSDLRGIRQVHVERMDPKVLKRYLA